MADRCLIVNADDFGLSAGVNRGVLRAHRQGIVTSASLMVHGAAAPAAAAVGRRHSGLSVGLHLDLCEWERRNGGWAPAYERVDSAAVAAEIDRQLERFRTLVGRGPTHLDSHQHVHRDEPARSLIADVAGSLGVPLRHAGPVRYCGAFYGQASDGTPLPEGIGPDALVSIVRDLPAGFTELCCHPSEEAELRSSYAAERLVELRSLCDPRVRRAVDAAGVRLCSFHDLTG
jgi:chitin disaccharide deacetylase